MPAPAAIASFPCSATQERCWFLDRLNPGTPALNVAVRWAVNGPVHAAAIEAAFHAVIARHEILRTRFVEDAGLPVQEVMPGAEFRLSEIDIRTTAAADQDARVDAIATENAALPFDLTRPGAIRATLIRLGNDRAILAITAHQICFDGWSIRILGREIGTCAAAFEAGTAPDLPDLPLQYGDYVLWQRAWFDSAAFAEDLAPWRDRLAGAPYFELQPDFPRPFTRSSACANVMADLPPAFGERLDAEARARGMSPFAYGSGVLSAMLARCTGAPEVMIGTQVAGRTEVDLEPLIGVFINNVVLRFATPADATLNDHLDRARSVVQEALIGQNVPFNKLVEIVNPARDASRTPLISVNFILQHAFMETAAYGGFELSSAPSHAPGAIYDLSFVLIGRATGWRMTLEYNPDLFSQDTARDLINLWQQCFGTAFDTPSRCLSDLPEPAHRASDRSSSAAQILRIETALEAHPAVAEAAAVPYLDAASVGRIHAFVTPEMTAHPIPLETLPALLADHVAGLGADGDACGISVLRDMPRDASGRLDRARLPLAAAQSARSAPRNDLLPAAGTRVVDVEAKLAAIWRDVLGLEEVSPAANFFDLGGHSLLTVRMLARIEQEFGRRLSLSSVYHSPTLRALARHLAGGEAAPPPAVAGDWRVLVLREEGKGLPIVAINNAQTVLALTNSFAAPPPACAVRIHDPSLGTTLVRRGFDEIAADYAQAVRSAQPNGPYVLFGICVHGNLAIEVARHLRAEGEEVAAVILKDVWEPGYGSRVGANRRTRILNRLHFLRVRLRFLRRGDISLAAFLGTFRLARASGILDAAVRLRLMERVRNTDLDVEQEAFIAYLSEARNRHRPAPYDGPVLHFVTPESPAGAAFDPEMGWGSIVTGRLETCAIDELSIVPGRGKGLAQAARRIEEFLGGSEADGGAAGGQPNVA